MLSRRELLRAAGWTLAGIAAAPVVTACGSSRTGGAVAVQDVARPADVGPHGDVTARSDAPGVIQVFGADLYRQVATAPGNQVYSPYSVAVALAMTRNGARGET